MSLDDAWMEAWLVLFLGLQGLGEPSILSSTGLAMIPLALGDMDLGFGLEDRLMGFVDAVGTGIFLVGLLPLIFFLGLLQRCGSVSSSSGLELFNSSCKSSLIGELGCLFFVVGTSLEGLEGLEGFVVLGDLGLGDLGLVG